MRHGDVGPAGRAKHGPPAFTGIALNVLSAREAGEFNLVAHRGGAFLFQYGKACLLGNLILSFFRGEGENEEDLTQKNLNIRKYALI
jgi:hypothetical protein